MDINKNEIEIYFSNLPSENERAYEKALAKLAEQCTSKEHISVLNEFIESNSKYAYQAFSCLMTILRRNRDFELMKELIDKHPEFKKRISYNHIIVQYLVHSESFYDYDDLLLMAYKDAQVFNKNSILLSRLCWN